MSFQVLCLNQTLAISKLGKKSIWNASNPTQNQSSFGLNSTELKTCFVLNFHHLLCNVFLSDWWFAADIFCLGTTKMMWFWWITLSYVNFHRHRFQHCAVPAFFNSWLSLTFLWVVSTTMTLSKLCCKYCTFATPAHIDIHPKHILCQLA